MCADCFSTPAGTCFTKVSHALQELYSAPAHHGPAVVAGHVLPGLNGHGQQATSAAAFVEESNPPKIRVVVRKRPLNSKVRVGPCSALLPRHTMMLIAHTCRFYCVHTDGIALLFTYVHGMAKLDPQENCKFSLDAGAGERGR